MQEQRPNPQQPFHPQPQRTAPPPPPRPAQSGGPPRIAPPPMNAPRTDIDLEPLELIDDDPTPVPSGQPGAAAATAHAPSKIQHFGTSIGSVTHQENYKRPTVATGKGAIRVRTFHGRLSDEGLVYMDSKINDWIDSHPDIEVKFATTTIGMYEGKIKEPALIVNVWY